VRRQAQRDAALDTNGKSGVAASLCTAVQNAAPRAQVYAAEAEALENGWMKSISLAHSVIRALRTFSSIALSVSVAHFAFAADVISTWDGSTNFWHSTSNWSHSAPSLLGYPSNGVQTYDVRIDSGQVTIDAPASINGLECHGGVLTLNRLLVANSPVVWTGGLIAGGAYGNHLEARAGF
jgi:hypothetical protein